MAHNISRILEWICVSRYPYLTRSISRPFLQAPSSSTVLLQTLVALIFRLEITAYFFCLSLPYICIRDLQRLWDKHIGHPSPGEEKANKCHEWLLYFCLRSVNRKRQLVLEKKEKRKAGVEGGGEFLFLIKASKAMHFLSKKSGVNYYM